MDKTKTKLHVTKNISQWFSYDRKKKVSLTLNKQAYVGIYILDLSKVLMYGFHYDSIKNKYDNKPRFLFSDTDNLMYKVWTEDIYEDFSKDNEIFDYSNYWTKSKYYDDLVVGKMKYETTGVPIQQFVKLKPIIYSFW